MGKISDSNEEVEALHNAETFVLDKLFNKSGSENSFVSIEDLMTSIDTAMSPLLDQAVEELIAESLIHSKDGENFQITPDGVSELKIRKNKAIPL